MSRTTDKPKATAKQAAAKQGVARRVASTSGAGKLAQGVTRRSDAPRAPSLAVARMRMQAGRTFWDALTPEQRAAGFDGPEASGRAPMLAGPAKQ